MNDHDVYVLRLFVTGTTTRSQRAIDNLKCICTEVLQGKYELEIVDVLQSPEKAEVEKILATPTLIRSLPPPIRRIVGDLSETEKVLTALDLKTRARGSSDE